MRMNLWELVRKVFCANKEAICVESQHAYRDRNRNSKKYEGRNGNRGKKEDGGKKKGRS